MSANRRLRPAFLQPDEQIQPGQTWHVDVAQHQRDVVSVAGRQVLRSRAVSIEQIDGAQQTAKADADRLVVVDDGGQASENETHGRRHASRAPDLAWQTGPTNYNQV